MSQNENLSNYEEQFIMWLFVDKGMDENSYMSLTTDQLNSYEREFHNFLGGANVIDTRK